MAHKLMVYGSLKQGYWNHSLLRGSKFLGATKTLPVFTMVAYSSFPAVLTDGNTAIAGEIFEIDDETLRRCDSLEGHPDWYKRIEVETELGKAWMYCMNPEHIAPRTPIIASGEWKP